MGVIKINNIIYGSNNSADIIYKNTTVEEKLNSIPVFDPSDNTNIEANQYDYLTYGHIVNALNSSDTSKALSANQGRVLSEKIDNIDLSYLEDGIAVNAENISNLDSDIELLNKDLDTVNTTLTNKISKNTTDISSLVNANNIYLNLTLSETTPLAVCQYLKQNLPNEKFHKNGVHFNAMVNNADYFSGHIYSDNANTYWGSLEQRGSSPDTHKFYKYMQQEGGADSVIPFSQLKKGTSTMAGYGKATSVNVGFKPKIIFAYCQSGNGYLITYFYAEGLINTCRRHSSQNWSQDNMISILDNGFSWIPIDQTWGSQTITWAAMG